MPDIFGSGEGEEGSGAKDNFVGKVIYSDTDDTHSSASAGSDEYDSDFEQVAVVEPLTQYENNQYIYGLDVSSSWGSKWMIFIGHFENIHGSLPDNSIGNLEELADFLVGNVYEWRDITFTEDEEFTWEEAPDGGVTKNIRDIFSGMENPPNNMIVPVRHVDDPQELAEYGEGESAEVEDVDF